MQSSTTTSATPRVFLGHPQAGRARGPNRPLIHPRALAEGLSSPAGLHRRPWLARLRRALANDLFVLHFQPIVSLVDGSVSHYEALLRLADEPDGSLVAPGSFLPAAERYGLIRDIDRMVVEKVAALLGGELAGHRCTSRSTSPRSPSPTPPCSGTWSVGWLARRWTPRCW